MARLVLIIAAIFAALFILCLVYTDGVYGLFVSVSLVTLFTIGSALLVWACAENGILCTFLAENRVAIIEGGEGNPVKMIANLQKGWNIDPKDPFKIVGNQEIGLPDDAYQKKNWLERLFGIYIIGPPWYSIKRFKMVHERMNSVILKDTPVSDWIKKDPIGEPESFLLARVLHDFLVADVELAKGYIIHVVVQVRLNLREPKISLYERMGGSGVVDFYRIIDQVVSTAVGNICRGMNYEDWLKEDKAPSSKTNGLCLRLHNAIETNLIALSGYEPEEVMIPRWDLTTGEQQDLVRSEEKARIEANIANLKAAAQNAEFTEAMKAAKEQFPDANDKDLIAMVTRIMSLKSVASSHLTVYAEGGSNLSVAVPSQQQNPSPKKGGRK